jgi:outer membrane lipoprotein SlyB
MTDFTKTFSADLLKTVTETMNASREARKSEPTLAERHARDEAIKRGEINEATKRPDAAMDSDYTGSSSVAPVGKAKENSASSVKRFISTVKNKSTQSSDYTGSENISGPSVKKPVPANEAVDTNNMDADEIRQNYSSKAREKAAPQNASKAEPLKFQNAPKAQPLKFQNFPKNKTDPLPESHYYQPEKSYTGEKPDERMKTDPKMDDQKSVQYGITDKGYLEGSKGKQGNQGNKSKSGPLSTGVRDDRAPSVVTPKKAPLQFNNNIPPVDMPKKESPKFYNPPVKPIKTPDVLFNNLLNNPKSKIDMRFETLDPPGKEDDDINNDGEVNSTDKYLENRRKKIRSKMKTESIAERYGLTELNTGGGTVKNAINQSGLSGPAQSISHSGTEFNNKLQSARKAGKENFSHDGKTYSTLMKEAAGVDKRAQDKHNCATHVYDKKLGEGLAIYGQHAEPDFNGDIAWYDVMFESGIERVMTEEVIVMMSEEHGNHKKKVVNEQGAHPIEPTGITADSASLATKRRRPKPVAEASETPKAPDLLGDFLKKNKYVKDAPEAPSAAPTSAPSAPPKPATPPAAPSAPPKAPPKAPPTNTIGGKPVSIKDVPFPPKKVETFDNTVRDVMSGKNQAPPPKGRTPLQLNIGGPKTSGASGSGGGSGKLPPSIASLATPSKNKLDTPTTRTVAKGLNVLGKAVVYPTIAYGAHELAADLVTNKLGTVPGSEPLLKKVARIGTGVVGMYVGGAVGAAVGTAIGGPIGSTIGGFSGGTAGYMQGAELGDAAYDAVTAINNMPYKQRHAKHPTIAAITDVTNPIYNAGDDLKKKAVKGLEDFADTSVGKSIVGGLTTAHNAAKDAVLSGSSSLASTAKGAYRQFKNDLKNAPNNKMYYRTEEILHERGKFGGAALQAPMTRNARGIVDFLLSPPKVLPKPEVLPKPKPEPEVYPKPKPEPEVLPQRTVPKAPTVPAPAPMAPRPVAPTVPVEPQRVAPVEPAPRGPTAPQRTAPAPVYPQTRPPLPVPVLPTTPTIPAPVIPAPMPMIPAPAPEVYPQTRPAPVYPQTRPAPVYPQTRPAEPFVEPTVRPGYTGEEERRRVLGLDRRTGLVPVTKTQTQIAPDIRTELPARISDIPREILPEPELGLDAEWGAHSIQTPLTPGAYNPNMDPRDYDQMWANLSSAISRIIPNIGVNKRKPKKP